MVVAADCRRWRLEGRERPEAAKAFAVEMSVKKEKSRQFMGARQLSRQREEPDFGPLVIESPHQVSPPTKSKSLFTFDF